MVYCSKCGRKNPDDARFCNACSAPLAGYRSVPEQEWERRYEEECSGRKGHDMSFIWGIILIMVGIWILLNFGFGKFYYLFNYDNPSSIIAWVVPVVIGLIIIAIWVRLIEKKKNQSW
jgi:uncharacterized membrane protein YvbJ